MYIYIYVHTSFWLCICKNILSAPGKALFNDFESPGNGFMKLILRKFARFRVLSGARKGFCCISSTYNFCEEIRNLTSDRLYRPLAPFADAISSLNRWRQLILNVPKLCIPNSCHVP